MLLRLNYVTLLLVLWSGKKNEALQLTHRMPNCPRPNPQKATIPHCTCCPQVHNTCMTCSLPSHSHEPSHLRSRYYKATCIVVLHQEAIHTSHPLKHQGSNTRKYVSWSNGKGLGQHASRHEFEFLH